MSNSRKFLLGIAAVLLIAFIFLARSRLGGAPAPEPSPDVKIELNETQKRQIFEPGKDWVTVYRSWSHEVWQISVDPLDTRGATPIGRLYSKAKPPEIAVPLYLCDFGTRGKPNVVLDIQKDCSRHGQALKPDPVGYGSEKIRTGYRLIFRCKSKEHGTYLSFKSDCENEGDRVETDLAAFRLVE